MGDLSHLSKNIFSRVGHLANLYLRGEVPSSKSDFAVGFDGERSIVPFRVYEFATREVEENVSCFVGKKELLDKWVEERGIERIDRFLYMRDLTAALKKGDNVELFVEFRNNVNWIREISFCILAEDIRKLSLSF